MLEDGLKTLLGTDTALTALISNRLYPVQGPPDQPTYPYVVYHDVTAASEYTFDGREWRERVIQFSVFGPRGLQNAQILKAIRNVLSGYAGTLTDSDHTRVLFSKRGTQSTLFDDAQQARGAFIEYVFQVSEV